MKKVTFALMAVLVLISISCESTNINEEIEENSIKNEELKESDI